MPYYQQTEDAEEALESNAVEVAAEAKIEIEVGKFYVTPLISEGKYNTWYMDSCENRNDDGTFQMDHLIRFKKGNLTWKDPRKADTSILDCTVNENGMFQTILPSVQRLRTSLQMIE